MPLPSPWEQQAMAVAAAVQCVSALPARSLLHTGCPVNHAHGPNPQQHRTLCLPISDALYAIRPLHVIGVSFLLSCARVGVACGMTATHHLQKQVLRAESWEQA